MPVSFTLCWGHKGIQYPVYLDRGGCPETVTGRALSTLLVQAETAWAVELVHQTWQDQKHDTFFSLEVPRVQHCGESQLCQLRDREGLSQDASIGDKVETMWKVSLRDSGTGPYPEEAATGEATSSRVK